MEQSLEDVFVMESGMWDVLPWIISIHGTHGSEHILIPGCVQCGWSCQTSQLLRAGAPSGQPYSMAALA